MFQLGVNGYPFLVNNNGFILYHPDFRPLVSIPLRDLIKFQLIFCTFLSRIFQFFFKKKTLPLQISTRNKRRTLFNRLLLFILYSNIFSSPCPLREHFNRKQMRTWHARTKSGEKHSIISLIRFIKHKKKVGENCVPKRLISGESPFPFLFKTKRKIYFNYCRCLFHFMISFNALARNKTKLDPNSGTSLCACACRMSSPSANCLFHFF
jgi:hypothetical protein